MASSSNNNQVVSLGDFTRLPLEVRRLIYEYALVDDLSTEFYIHLASNAHLGRQALNLNVLYMNHAIHREASQVLYEKMRLALSLGDVFGLRPHVHDLTESHTDVWMWDPTIALQNINTAAYDYRNHGAQLGGRLQPHIFARFQNITIDARIFMNYDFLTNTEPIPVLDFDLNTLGKPSDGVHIRESTKGAYLQLLRSSNLFPALNLILKNSPIIRNLKIVVTIQDAFCFDYDSNMVVNDEGPVKALIWDLIEACALGLLMDSGFLTPLRELDNVEKCEMVFVKPDFDEDGNPSAGSMRVMDLVQPRCLEIARDLEYALAENFVRRSVRW